MVGHRVNYKLLIVIQNTVKRSLFTLANVLLFVLISSEIFAQTISYSPNTYTFPSGISIGSISPTGTTASSFTFGTGATVATGLDHPWGLGIDPSGNVYIANYGSTSHIPGAVTEYNPVSATMTTFADGNNAATNIANPQGIAFDQSGNAYVLNYNRTNNGHGNYFGNAEVDLYSPAGAYTSPIISGLGAASGITNDLSNNLYIANAGNTTASEYNSSGTIAFSVNGVTLPDPVGVAVDNSGNIYVVDNTNKKVYKFSSTGAYISTPVTGLTNPFGVAIDASGNMYVGDSGADAVFDTPATTAGAVKIYNSAGTYMGNLAGSYLDPRGLVIDPTGNLYVSDFANNTLTKYPATGGYHLDKILPPGLSFDSNTGTFSGTPTAAFATTTYTVTAYNAGVAYTTTITITCTATLAISYSPNINVFTLNTNISSQTPPVLTISGASGTKSFTISPTLPTGLSIDGSTGAITGTPTAVSAAKVYTVTCTNGANTATTTLSIACVVDDYWTGKNSTDWFDTKNWSTGAVPTGSTVQASIGVQNYTGKKLDPTVTANATVYYLELGATRQPTITVSSGKALTINSTLTIDNNAAPTVTGSGSINMAPTADVDVEGSGVLTINSTLTFTLQSDATGSASVGQITTGGIIGNVSVQRYIPGGAGYRGYILLSSPVNTGSTDSHSNSIYSINYLVNSTYVSGTGFSTTYPSGYSKSGNPSLYLYRENLAPVNTSFITGNYRGISDMTASPSYTLNGDGSGFDIPVGNGYLMFFRGGSSTVNPYSTSSTPAAATLTATGTLNQGSITYKNWYTPVSSNLMYTTASADATIEGFNLVGNPYACTIDLGTYVAGGITMSNVSMFVYELDPISKAYGVYELDNPAVATNHASRYIASGQGFFIKASNASATLTFNESCKAASEQNTGSSLLLSKTPVVKEVPRFLRLQMAMDSTNRDETIISFKDNAKSVYVFNEDAPYRPGTSKVNIASLSSDNKTIAVNTLPLDTKGVSIRINVGATANGTYSLNMNSIEGIPELYDVWLMDAYRKDSVDMRHNKTYSFDVVKTDTASYGAYRFKLILRQNPALAVHLLNFTASKATGKQVQLAWVTEHEANYTNFTVERSTDGGATYAVVGGVPSTGAGTYSLIDKTPGENNLYRLKQEDINNNITYSHIIPVAFANQGNVLTGNSISVYPNPASSAVSVAVKTAVKNNSAFYQFMIINNYGLVIKQGTSAQANWQANVNDLPPGSYIVKVRDSKAGNYIGDTKFIKN
jgi:sugar lactone lactonase YvrE